MQTLLGVLHVYRIEWVEFNLFKNLLMICREISLSLRFCELATVYLIQIFCVLLTLPIVIFSLFSLPILLCLAMMHPAYAEQKSR